MVDMHAIASIWSSVALILISWCGGNKFILGKYRARIDYFTRFTIIWTTSMAHSLVLANKSIGFPKIFRQNTRTSAFAAHSQPPKINARIHQKVGCPNMRPINCPLLATDNFVLFLTLSWNLETKHLRLARFMLRVWWIFQPFSIFQFTWFQIGCSGCLRFWQHLIETATSCSGFFASYCNTKP